MIELYPFQQDDVVKLRSVKAALIGSEMGTGKTHEAIALDELWNPEPLVTKRPTLVIAPTNTHVSWVEKYSEQSPRTDVTAIDRTIQPAKSREEFIEAIRRMRGEVFIVHWEALQRLTPEFRRLGIAFGLVVADEVHRASNRKAKTTLALKGLKTAHKLGMSGTATGDKPDQLWSTLNWLYPTTKTKSTQLPADEKGLLGSYWKFRKTFCKEETNYVSRGGNLVAYSQIVGSKNLDVMHEMINPFYVRHLKRESCCVRHPNGVMPWLPEKTYDTIEVELSTTQRRVYDQMRKEMVAWIGEHEDSPLVANVVIAQLTRLSQIALATPYFVPSTNVNDPRPRVKLCAPSSKIGAVGEFIADHMDKQFVLFSSSKQACYLAQEELGAKGITSEVLSGDTKQALRPQAIKSFQEGKFQVFIGVIEAVAEGIDGLQFATDTAIFLDRSWRTIKNKQAEDRLHRDGQKDTVQIIDIVARNTVDSGRNQDLVLKWWAIKEMLGDHRKRSMQ